jgi:hypothetical protein
VQSTGATSSERRNVKLEAQRKNWPYFMYIESERQLAEEALAAPAQARPRTSGCRLAIYIYIYRIRAAAGIGSACGLGASPTPDLQESARAVPTYT